MVAFRVMVMDLFCEVHVPTKWAGSLCHPAAPGREAGVCDGGEGHGGGALFEFREFPKSFFPERTEQSRCVRWNWGGRRQRRRVS